MGRKKGSALLVLVIIAGAVLSLIGFSTAKLSQAALASFSSSKIAVQAQQYAQAEAIILKAEDYLDLENKSRLEIENSEGFQREVELSAETDYTDEIKQRIATIRIYKGTETLPRYTLKTVLLSVKQEASGVPIGTIIAWASTSAPDDGGVWLLCNGQSCASYPELVNVLGSNSVPNYTDRFLQGNSTPNTIKEAGLPNIVGQIRSFDHAGGGTSGVFALLSRWSASVKNGASDNWGTLLKFDASRSNPIYGASTTVQPPAMTVRFLIKAA